jgi:CPA2 family monovalent cation:H+ antiporter-2
VPALPHDTPLITTLVVGLSLAFLFGMLAHRLKLPMLAGYLVAGVVIGPFTPGFVADQEIASELAELGVILLMFGVGMHFSLKELLAVKTIAIPGAIGQIAVATAAGTGLAALLGWSLGAGLIFGLSLSVASTVVLLRALQERGIVQEERGHIAVGWLIVEDLVMVIALVMIPPLAGLLGGVSAPVEEGAEKVAQLGIGPVAATLLLTAVKVASFVALMLIVGRRVIPAVLHYVAHTGQRELFRLSVLAIALGVAWASSTFFGVSFALGAFFAGMVMAGSTLSTQAMKETLPLRDAFAVLFFVSVGMLFNPSILWTQPFSVLVTVLIILAVKAVAAYAIVRAFGRDRETGLTIAASLAQIGEFSFILIVMGVKLYIVPVVARDLVVAGALVSILANPLMFKWLDHLIGPASAPPEPVAEEPPPQEPAPEEPKAA